MRHLSHHSGLLQQPPGSCHSTANNSESVWSRHRVPYDDDFEEEDDDEDHDEEDFEDEDEEEDIDELDEEQDDEEEEQIDQRRYQRSAHLLQLSRADAYFLPSQRRK